MGRGKKNKLQLKVDKVIWVEIEKGKEKRNRIKGGEGLIEVSVEKKWTTMEGVCFSKKNKVMRRAYNFVALALGAAPESKGSRPGHIQVTILPCDGASSTPWTYQQTNLRESAREETRGRELFQVCGGGERINSKFQSM